MSKPITLYSHATGPNPWKVAFVLEELGLPYETKFVKFDVIKQEPYISVNINGRVPAIEDPNTGVTLWESGAIIQYLVDNYDKDQKISYGNKVPEKYLLDQWLHFQMSGQGPYFGQKAWFSRFHPEQLPSAISRYENEIKRVVKVVDSHLAKNGTGYLVGNKYTYADIAWIPWDAGLPFLLGEEGYNQLMNEAPHFKKWHDSLVARPAISKVLADKQAAVTAGY